MDTVTQVLEALSREAVREIGRISRHKPLDLNLDGEGFGADNPDPILNEAEKRKEAFALFDAVNAPDPEEIS